MIPRLASYTPLPPSKPLRPHKENLRATFFRRYEIQYNTRLPKMQLPIVSFIRLETFTTYDKIL